MVEMVKRAVRGWWGLAMPVLVFLASDLGLPGDAPWWARWALAATSLASYLVGRLNGAGGILLAGLSPAERERVADMLDSEDANGSYRLDSTDDVMRALLAKGAVIRLGELSRSWCLAPEWRASATAHRRALRGRAGKEGKAV